MRPKVKSAFVLSDFDSRLSWVEGFTARLLSRGYHVDLGLLGSKRCNTKYSFNSVNVFSNYKSVARHISNGDYTLFIVALGGGAHIKLLHEIEDVFLQKKKNKRPVIITGFNGVEDVADSHGLFCRTGSDFIAISSPVFMNASVKFFQAKNYESSELYLSGFIRDYWDAVPKLDAEIAQQNKNEINNVLFVLQPGIIDHPKQLDYLAKKLLEYGLRYPNRKIVIKARGPKKGKHVNSAAQRKEYMPFWRRFVKKAPPNFDLVFGSIEPHLYESDLVISFTSTALLEAVILGKKVVALSDFGISKTIGNVFLLGSGILVPFSDCITDNLPALNNDWIKNNLVFNGEYVDNLIVKAENLYLSQEKSQQLLSFKKKIYNQKQNSYLFRLFAKNNHSFQ